MRTFQRFSRFIRPTVATAVLAVLAIGGLMVLALGCGPGKELPAAAAPAVNPRLPDVPVPFGFKFIEDKSKDRMAGGTREVEHRYEGDAPVRQVSEFYRLHMQSFGWTLKEETFAGGRQRFTFQKGAETCYISIWDDWGTKVLINVPRAALAVPTPPVTTTKRPTP